MQRFAPGEPIVLREVWDDRIWAAYPAIAVDDREDLFVNLVPHGVTMQRPMADDGSILRIPTDRWSLRPARWSRERILAFSFPGRPYAVLLLWDPETDVFAGFYLNIETNLGRTPLGLDYVDHLLDVRVAPDRSAWSWKDEDELAEAVALGIYTEDDTRVFRAAGERALRHVMEAEPPFDRDWSGWRPDPSWPMPELRRGWDAPPG